MADIIPFPTKRSLHQRCVDVVDELAERLAAQAIPFDETDKLVFTAMLLGAVERETDPDSINVILLDACRAMRGT
uniref:Uncharacterized protein n=1 Tax=Caulobacter sp. (strain K31) TaxID=366602 RepID=B0T626_CAUSK